MYREKGKKIYKKKIKQCRAEGRISITENRSRTYTKNMKKKHK